MTLGSGGTRAPTQRALPGFLYSLLGRALRASARLVVLFFVARHYEVQDVATFAVLTVVAALVGYVADLGLGELLVREIAAGGARSAALEAKALAIRVVLLPIGVLLAYGLAVVIDSRTAWPALGTIAFASSVVAADFMASVQRGHGRYDLEALESSMPILGVAAALAFATFSRASFDRFELVLGVFSFGPVASRCAALLRRARLGGALTAPLAPTIGETVRASRWFLAKALVQWALFESPVILVRRLGDDNAAALFALALRPVGLLTHPFQAISLVFYPALAHARTVSNDAFRRSIRRLNRISLLLVPGGFAGSLLAGHWLLGVPGGSYLAALPVLAILASAYLLYLGPPNGVPLVVMEQERTTVMAAAVGILVLLAASLWLVPSMGAVGGALALGAGLATVKLAYGVAYVRARIPLWDGGQVAPALATTLLLAVPWVVSGWLAAGLLATVGATSVWLTMRLINRTVLFATDAPSPS